MTPAIRDCATKYIWWQAPEEAALRPRRVMAQVMNFGSFADVRDLEKAAGPDALADVIRHAEPGWFSRGSGIFGTAVSGWLWLVRCQPCLFAASREEFPAALRHPARASGGVLAGIGAVAGSWFRPLRRHGHRAAPGAPPLGRFRFLYVSSARPRCAETILAVVGLRRGAAG